MKTLEIRNLGALVAALAAKGDTLRLGVGERGEAGVAGGAGGGGGGVADSGGGRVYEVAGGDGASGEDRAAHGLGERDSDGRRRRWGGGGEWGIEGEEGKLFFEEAAWE